MTSTLTSGVRQRLTGTALGGGAQTGPSGKGGGGAQAGPSGKGGGGAQAGPSGTIPVPSLQGWVGAGLKQVPQVWEGLVVSVPVFVRSGRLGSTSSDG